MAALKLKPFSAATEDEAMARIRQELGENAIIVSTHRSGRGRGVQILAALEDPDDGAAARTGKSYDEGDLLYERLTYHGVSERNIYRLVRQAVRSGLDDPTRKLGMALAEYLEFAPIPVRPRGIKMLVGAPGVGKTSVTAKLAARAVMNRESVLVGTTDMVRPAAIAQLQALTAAMELELLAISTPEKLRAIAAANDADAAFYLDTPGINPFNDAELLDLQSFISAGEAEPILVLSAGQDAQEAKEVSQAFQSIGCKRMIITRLDCARRLGAFVELSMAGDLALSEVSMTASIVEGMLPMNEIRLARLLLQDPLEQHAIKIVPAAADRTADQTADRAADNGDLDR
jgi:flagellar biosynthesis protein FlhF